MQRREAHRRGPHRIAALAALSFLAFAANAASLSVQVQGPAGGALADAVVFLESAEARAAVKPLKEAEIAQTERRFVPQVSIVTLGTAVRFPNRDTVRHHVYSFSPAKNFELKLYAGTPANPVVFDKAGVVVLGCNIHDTMTGWVLVLDTPYHGRTSAQGTVTLADVPPGSYRLRAWHASLPPGSAALDQPVTLGADAAPVTVRLGAAR
jgi:plastocyanin